MTDLHICTLDSFCGQWNGKYQRFKDKMAKKLMEAERKKKDKAEDDAEEMTAEDSMVSSDVLDSIADDEIDRLLAFHAPTYEYIISVISLSIWTPSFRKKEMKRRVLL